MITYLALNIHQCCGTEVTLILPRFSSNNIILCSEYMLEESLCNSIRWITMRIRGLVPFNVIWEDVFECDFVYFCRQITPMRSVSPCVMAGCDCKVIDECMNPLKFPIGNLIRWRWFPTLTLTWSTCRWRKLIFDEPIYPCLTTTVNTC